MNTRKAIAKIVFRKSSVVVICRGKVIFKTNSVESAKDFLIGYNGE